NPCPHQSFPTRRSSDLFSPSMSTNTFTVVSGATQTLFGGLAANTPYWFQVRAVNLNGTPSAWSAAASTTTQGSPPPTGPAFNAVDGKTTRVNSSHVGSA